MAFLTRCPLSRFSSYRYTSREVSQYSKTLTFKQSPRSFVARNFWFSFWLLCNRTVRRHLETETIFSDLRIKVMNLKEIKIFLFIIFDGKSCSRDLERYWCLVRLLDDLQRNLQRYLQWRYKRRQISCRLESVDVGFGQRWIRSNGGFRPMWTSSNVERPPVRNHMMDSGLSRWKF